MPDYRELWKTLGVDLEKHDLLCAALPGLYENTYLSQNVRPEAMNYFNLVVAEIHGLRIQELANYRAGGGKVFGTFCVFVPDEIILAAKGIGIGLCGGSQFWVPEGEKVLPRALCPLIKASVGAAVSRTCPYFLSCDLLVGETTCDGKKKAWEILEEFAPVYVMNLPQMKRDKDVADWKEEIKAFLNKVEEITGNKVTAEALARAIQLTNRRRQVLMRLYEARKADPVPISGKDALLVSQIAFYDDPQRFIAKTTELCAEIEEWARQGKGVFPAGTPRILVTGTPMAIPNWKLHHIIETSGAVVVCEETCTGTRYFEHLVPEGASTLEGQIESLAERYLKINCACFTPNTGRVKDILRLASEFRVDGVVYYNLPFCHTYNVEYRMVEKALKEAGIPVLQIETDYGEEDLGQVRNRVEAFIEMLK